MNDILFGNNNSKVITKLSKRYFKKNKVRNLAALLAIILTAFLFTSITSLAFNMASSIQLSLQMQKGSKADGTLGYMTEEQYEQVAAAIPGEVETNYQLYLESLEKPMPFYIGVPVIEDNKLKLIWDVSYDLDAEDITYTVEVARDYLFQDVIYSSENQLLPEMEMDVPEAGQYFVRVRAGNKSGYTQDAFDYYVTDSGKNYGMKCFYVTEDDQIEEDIYDEK